MEKIRSINGAAGFHHIILSCESRSVEAPPTRDGQVRTGRAVPAATAQHPAARLGRAGTNENSKPDP